MRNELYLHCRLMELTDEYNQRYNVHRIIVITVEKTDVTAHEQHSITAFSDIVITANYNTVK